MRLSRAVPALPVRDVTAAVERYVGPFGFTCVHLDPTGFAVLVRDDVELHLWQADDAGWRERPDQPVCSGAEDFLAGTASCRIQVDDVDALHPTLRDVLHPAAGDVVDTDFGTREFATLDLDGNLLTFFQVSAG